ncbi:MAG: ABC-F family ATP-binding cassette domain-containing protein [Phyllobacteriaceae bacterium]|nr:ABC-F family ATP-binding cassette domain-containing protein [Phyllobacteriaceae bacterium]
MAAPLIQLDGLKLTFGGAPLFVDVSLSVEPGARIALVGRNGSGKSTLLKIVAGLAEAQDGTVFRQPSATVRYLPQEPDWGAAKTVRAYVETGLAPGDDPHRATMILDALGLTGEEEPRRLSGGESRRAALARTLAPSPDILLLDEPTNHLDLAAIEWLEAELKRMGSALVTISHDRRFLENVTDATVWLDRGRTLRLDKGFAWFEEWRDKVLEEEEREQHKLGRQIVREEHWLRYGVSARRKRNMRRLGELQDMRARHRAHRGPDGAVKMTALEAGESGRLVIEAKGVAKAFDDRAIVRDFSLRVQRGDRLGLVGPNGAGKTTLVKLLTGHMPPDSGTVRLGANLEIAALDQQRALDPTETLAHYLTDGRGETLVVNGEEKHVASWMKDFLFKPEQMRTPVGELSGGERARLMLARVLSRPSNFLVLDEPTNDLDMETLDLLEELVAGFAGTVLLVSHDRDFLDRTATGVLYPEGDGRWTQYAGGFADMMAQRAGAAKEAKAAAKPKAETPRGEPGAPREGAKKLSYKQKFALETLPGRIEALNDDIAALEAKLADPAFYGRDPKAFAATSATIGDKRAELARLEGEWLELEMLREEIGG